MRTLLIVGVTAAVILLLTVTAIVDRYAYRKRNRELKRWVMSHYGG